MRKALALACAFTTLTVFSAQAGDACGTGHMRSAGVRDGALVLRWDGRIDRQMATDIAAEFHQHKRASKTVSLSLKSCGGNSGSMEAIINVLTYIKATHSLTTVVDRGSVCGSACVPIFLAGHRRVGALASLWFFHPASRQTPQRGTAATRELHPDYTDSMITRYFVPAGVDPDWILQLRRTLNKEDLWQTGRDLWETNSNILTETLDNKQPREEGPIELAPALACGLVCRG